MMIALPVFVHSASQELEILLTDPLIDSQSPSYHGSYELAGSSSFDLNYFINISSVNFCNESCRTFLHKLKDDDVILKVFEYLDDDLINLAKLSFSSRRLYRLLSSHFTRKFFLFNPKIFWLLPQSVRFRFAVKYLDKFEKQFPGLRGKVNLSLNELIGLMLVTLHCKNVFFMISSELKLIKSINYRYFSALNSKSILPFYSPSIWRTVIISDAIKLDAFFTIEAICKIDKSLISNVIALFAKKLGILETTLNEKIPRAIEDLLRKILSISSDLKDLKSLLLLSVDHGAISTFSAFLPLWTENLDQILSQSPNDRHIILKIAINCHSCPEILSRPDLTHFQLSSALLNCEQVGNYVFATELLSHFPSNVFLTHFDPDILNLIKQIVLTPIAANTPPPPHIPQEFRIPVALLLASFHFQQPKALVTFDHLIHGDGDRVNKVILKILLAKRTIIYYDIAIRRRGASHFHNTCTLF